MLVLTRNKDDSVIIGEGINKVEMRILGIRGTQVRLGFAADKSIPIHRKEIYDKIHNPSIDVKVADELSSRAEEECK